MSWRLLAIRTKILQEFRVLVILQGMVAPSMAMLQHPATKKNIFKEGDNLGCHLDTDQGTLDFYKNTQLIAKVKYPQTVNLRASVSLFGQQTIELRTLNFGLDSFNWQ